MIEINLLPPELKSKRKAFKMPDITLLFLPTLAGIVVFLVFIQVVLFLTITIKRGASQRMEREYSEIKDQRESVAASKRENLSTRKKTGAIEGLMNKKLLWSKKLNQLSDLIIPGVWFTQLSIEKMALATKPQKSALGRRRASQRLPAGRAELPYLSITGQVSSVYGEELALIGRLIERLKEDRDFFRDFSNIELLSTDLHTIEDVEVTEFNINCYFKQVKE